MKKNRLLFCILLFLMISKESISQYGGHTIVGSTTYLGAGSIQGIFSDITYSDASITGHPSSTVYFVGSAPNTQHQLIANIGGATATQIGSAILNNGTGGLLINNNTFGLEITTNFNFNAQNAQVTTLRNASSVANNNLRIDANASISGFNATNNVNGYLKKEGDASGFIFPIADGTAYAPMTVGAIGAGNSITAAYYKSSGSAAAAYTGGPFSVTSFASPLLSVSSLEYWDIGVSGTPNALMSLAFYGDYSVASLATLFIVGWKISTGKWEQIPSGPATGLTPGNTISSTGNVNFSDYSAFTIAATTIVLPFNLKSFTAKKTNNKVLLSWITSSESNLNIYIVERSNNGSTGWVSIGSLSATNTATGRTYSLYDNIPLNGNNYYRLKTVSTNGIITYSLLRLVVISKPAISIELYPNPAVSSVTVSINGILNNRYSIHLIDATGKLLQQKTSIETGVKYQFDISQYTKGSYYINLFNQTNLLLDSKKFIKQ